MRQAGGTMQGFWLAAFLILCLLVPWRVSFSADLAVPELRGHVNDYAGVLGGRTGVIEGKLKAYEQASGSQVVVLTVADLDGRDIESYANEVFHAWKLGSKDVDDGVLIVLAVRDRRARIEVGYGLEGTLTDLASSRILRDTMHPRFAAGDYAGGVEAGVDAVLAVLAGQEPQSSPVRTQATEPWWVLLFPLLFMAVFSLIAAVSRGMRLLWMPVFANLFVYPLAGWLVGLVTLLVFVIGIYGLRLRGMRKEFLRRTSSGRMPTNITVRTWPPRFMEVWSWQGSGQGRRIRKSADGSAVTFWDSGGSSSSSSSDSDFSGGGGDSGGGGASDSW